MALEELPHHGSRVDLDLRPRVPETIDADLAELDLHRHSHLDLLPRAWKRRERRGIAQPTRANHGQVSASLRLLDQDEEEIVRIADDGGADRATPPRQ